MYAFVRQIHTHKDTISLTLCVSQNFPERTATSCEHMKLATLFFTPFHTTTIILSPGPLSLSLSLSLSFISINVVNVFEHTTSLILETHA